MSALADFPWVVRPAPAPRDRTALVLSAGGMFGAYQAGVWRVLEGALQPDIVVGASIGSLNGWLIAGGCSGRELVQRWLTLKEAARHRWRIPRFLSEGMVDPCHVERWIRDIHEACRPRLDYGLVTTHLPSLRPHLFRGPHLSWKHLASSCAVPLFLNHHRLNGSYYSDGGLVEPLPVWAAVQMGATRIVAVDLLVDRPRLLRAITCAAAWYCGHRPGPFGAVEILRIAPARRLGTAWESICWSRENAERWIELGEKDALAAKHFVVKCFERVH